MKAYSVEVKLSKQEDGLWRAQVPGLQGCFVDASKLADALRDVHEAAAMFIDLYEEEDRPLPDSIRLTESNRMSAKVIVIPQEITVKRPAARTHPRTPIG